MATNPAGIHGAIFDPDPSNGIGGLNTGIGIGPNAVHGASRPFPQDAAASVYRIGGGVTAPAQPVGFAGKALKYNVAAAAVAVGGAFPDTYVNRSGLPVPIGGGTWSVAP